MLAHASGLASGRRGGISIFSVGNQIAEYALVTHPCGKIWRGAQINHSARALSTADAAQLPGWMVIKTAGLRRSRPPSP